MLKTSFRQFKSTLKYPTAANSKKLYVAIILSILILAIALRLVGLNKGFWLDEYFTIRWLDIGNFPETTIALKDYNKPPLYFLIFYLWAKINTSEPFWRSLSIISDVGTVIVVVNWLKPYSKLASLLAGLYFATTPIMLRYGQEIRPYSLLVFATALTFYFASQIIRKPERVAGYIGVSLSLSLAVATHLIALMLLLPIGILLAVAVFSEHKKIYWYYLLPTFLLPGLIFVYFYFFFLTGLDVPEEGWWMPELSWGLIASTANYVFGLPQLIGSYVFKNQLNTWAFIALLLSLIVVSKAKSRLSWLLLLAAFLFWLQIAVYSVIDTSIFWYRIILPGIVPFIAFVVLRIAAIEKPKLRLIYTLGTIACCAIFSIHWVTVQAYKPVEEYRYVAEVINKQWHPEDLVVLSPGFIYGGVDYYLERVPTEELVVLYDTTNLEKLNRAISQKLATNITPQNVFLVVRDLAINDYQNLLSTVDSRIPKPVDIYLLSILNHDTYFLDRPDTKDKLLATTQMKLGKPSYIKNTDLYAIAKWEQR